MKKLTIGQRTALNQHLTEYPDNLTFGQIIFRLINNDLYDEDDENMEICVQEYFQDWCMEALGEHLTSIAESIDERNLKAYGVIK